MSLWRCLCSSEYRLNRGCDLCVLVMENDPDYIEEEPDYDEEDPAHLPADMSTNSNQGGAMSITEALLTLGELLEFVKDDMPAKGDLLRIVPEAEQAIPVLEAYIAEKEGQGGLF